MQSADAKAVMERAKDILMDKGGVFWSNASIQDWMNESVRLYMQLKPENFARQYAFTVDQESATQSLPDSVMVFIRALRNTNGPAVTRAELDEIAALDRRWMDRKSRFVVNYCYNPEASLRTFQIYPRPTARDASLELSCVFEPEPCDVFLADGKPNPASRVTTIPVMDVGSVVDFVLGRAHQQQHEAESKMVADMYFRSFFTKLGMPKEAELFLDRGRRPFSKTTGGAE